jgi:hypothetical protein
MEKFIDIAEKLLIDAEIVYEGIVSKKELKFFLSTRWKNEGCKKKLPSQTLDQAYRLLIFDGLRTIYTNEEELSFENIRMFSLERLSYLLKTYYLDSFKDGSKNKFQKTRNLLFQILQQPAWLSALKSSAKLGTSDMSFLQYRYFFSTMFLCLNVEDEIYKSAFGKAEPKQKMWSEEKLRIPIEESIYTLFNLGSVVVNNEFDQGITFSSIQSAGLQTTNQIKIFRYNQAYLLGRYFSTSLVDHSTDHNRQDVSSSKQLFEHFNMGRAKMLQEKSENISKLADFLNSIFIQGRRFLIPEINFIIAEGI